jgi:type VI protein secretion system component VasK
MVSALPNWPAEEIGALANFLEMQPADLTNWFNNTWNEYLTNARSVRERLNTLLNYVALDGASGGVDTPQIKAILEAEDELISKAGI